MQQRNSLTITVNSLQVDIDNLNARLEEEGDSANQARTALGKLQGEYGTLKSRYEKEVIMKTEELEDMR